MGTQVAAKELLCLTDRAKDDAARKRRERGKEEGDGASDSGSDRCLLNEHVVLQCTPFLVVNMDELL
jgi:hypothetical protein